MTGHADNSQLSARLFNGEMVLIPSTPWRHPTVDLSVVIEGRDHAGIRSAAATERGLVSYLVVPRPQDLVKILLAPATYVVAAGAAGDFDRLRDFLALWLALEFLVYHARYQWNDVRGLADDREHPARGLRARLPVGATDADTRRNMRASLAVAGARIVAAVLVGEALGLVQSVMLLIVAVFSIAVVYEALRARPPGRLRVDARPRDIAVWIVVGLGYAVRGGVGLALAGLTADRAAMAAGVAFFAAFGSMYVLLSWALEATNSCARIGEHWTVREGLRRKPHISTLVRHLDGSPGSRAAFSATSEWIGREEPRYLGAAEVLNGRGRITAPWNIALLAAAASAGALGAQLAGVGAPPAQAMTIALCFGGAVGLARSGGSRPRWGVAAAVAVALEAVALSVEASPEWPVALPWLATAACYTALLATSYLGSMGLGVARKVRERGDPD
jgi:hypothetical protein